MATGSRERSRALFFRAAAAAFASAALPCRGHALTNCDDFFGRTASVNMALETGRSVGGLVGKSLKGPDALNAIAALLPARPTLIQREPRPEYGVYLSEDFAPAATHVRFSIRRLASGIALRVDWLEGSRVAASLAFDEGRSAPVEPTELTVRIVEDGYVADLWTDASARLYMDSRNLSVEFSSDGRPRRAIVARFHRGRASVAKTAAFLFTE